MTKTEHDLPETIRRIEEASSWKQELRDELMTFRDYLGNADKSYFNQSDKRYWDFLMNVIYHITNNQLKEETNV